MIDVKKIVISMGAIMFVAFLIFLCSIAGRGVVIGLWDVPEKLNWKEKTTPLDPAVVEYMCKAFSLPDKDQKCQTGSIVYAPDFFGIIRETFIPKDGPWATYEEVQEKIGEYQYAYEPPVTTGDGITYFRARYDLNGDRVYPIIMFFYDDGRLWRLVADVGD